MTKYEFPSEVFSYILTFLPRHYRKPPHLMAINNCKLFADFTCDTLMDDDSEMQEELTWLGPIWGWAAARDAYDFGYRNGWRNSFIRYKKWREFINCY